MTTRRTLAAALGGSLCILSVLAGALRAADAPLTPAQTLDRYTIADPRFSPDGAHVAFAVTEPVKGAARKTNIWMLDVGAAQPRRFTAGPRSDTSPRWSPDGRSLAFLSDREEGATAIYIVNLDGGEATRLTTGKLSVQAFDWSPDGKQIACLARVPKTDEQEKKDRDKDDARVVDDGSARVQAWIVEVPGGSARQVTHGAFTARSIQWLPAGGRVIVVSKDPPESQEWSERIASVDVASGDVKVIATPKGPVGSTLVSPDGRFVAWTGARVDGPSAHDLFVAPTGGGAPKNVTGASVDRPIGSYAWRPDGTITAVVTQGFSSGLYTVRPDGTAAPMALSVLPSAFAVSSSGRLAVVGQTATRLPELYLSSPAGALERVSDFHAAWAKTAILAPRPFRYKSFDGVEIDAALLVPPDAPAGRRLPLVVLVHGGPTGRWAAGFEPWGQLLAARGFAVLYPNIRGSVGYGQAFIESNRADWGGGDFKDVMAGVDALVAQGVADPQRLGIGGWSYGGYMAAWAITQTDRFKASVSGACMSDLASEFGTEDSSAGDAWFYGTPYERQADFIRSSPITFVKRAKTPTLILQGENDTTDPVGQSQQLYRGLRHYDVPVEFVLYPREPHGLREEKHQVDMLGRMVGWFERYLK
jgi:dipeptidyl aminopeptidase/acylaminoacyl peptidase